MSSTVEQELAVSKVYSKTETAPKQHSGDSTLMTGSDSTKAPEFKMDFRMLLAFISLMVITLAAALDATIISVALPTMAKELKGTATEAFWTGTSFLLASTIIQPVFGSFSHIFGRKPMILTSLVFFTVGAILCGVAKNFTLILVGRTIQGIGGGGIISVSEIIITDLVPLRERGKYFGFFSTMWALGSVLGPVLGGVFSQKVSWQWVFWLNLPFCGIGFIMIPLFLKLNFLPTTMAAKLRRVDYIGGTVFVASTTSFLIPITWGGTMYAWDSWRTLVPLIVGAAGIVGFVLYELYVAEDPLIRMGVFKQRTAAVSYIETVMHGIVLWGLLYYLPLYYLAVKNQTAILAGVSVFPQTFTVAPASVVVGIIVSVTGKFRWAIWTGWALTILGVGLLYLLDVNTPTVSWIFLNLVSGLGTGMLFPSMAMAIQAAAPANDTGYAVAMFSFLRAGGQTFGVAIGGMAFQNFLKAKIRTFPELAPLADEYAKDAAALVEVIKSLPFGQEDQLREHLVWAYAAALKNVWLVFLAFAIIGGAVSIFTEELSLNREHETDQGFKRKEKPIDAEKVEA
ncbi:hypothetical protein H072_5333 [Dactylellina haptotyla CBS 200.50]|uniref:Major facilitator superfamily (MFS) profile domain-containing protein n=1 Tax=Dactylellina haptotyla (strain CBS 200.50) TaxID=1284197 RepID=S8ACX6_DACHA|nr:hypothetical protein H072_5333 [Dactylellina haptotyla CBS 200.50]